MCQSAVKQAVIQNNGARLRNAGRCQSAVKQAVIQNTTSKHHRHILCQSAVKQAVIQNSMGTLPYATWRCQSAVKHAVIQNSNKAHQNFSAVSVRRETGGHSEPMCRFGECMECVSPP